MEPTAEKVHIGYLALLFEVGLRRAHQLAKEYKWPFELDERGYKLYDVQAAVLLTPTRDIRVQMANLRRCVQAKAWHAARKEDAEMAATALAEADDWRRT